MAKAPCIVCGGKADLLCDSWLGWERLRGQMAKEVPNLLLMQLVCSGKPVMHFGLTQCAQPTHPQMLGYATKLRPWVLP